MALMVAMIFYIKDSPGERLSTDLAQQLERAKVDVKLLEADGVEGASMAELYDVTSRPAVVLTRNDGSAVAQWQSEWPLASDISYLAHT